MATKYTWITNVDGIKRREDDNVMVNETQGYKQLRDWIFDEVIHELGPFNNMGGVENFKLLYDIEIHINENKKKIIINVNQSRGNKPKGKNLWQH